MKKFKKIFSLKPNEVLIYSKVALVLLGIRMGLELMTFSNFKKLYKNKIRERNIPEDQIETYALATKRIASVFNFVCLPQALCLKYFLGENKDYKLKIGINITEKFKAHAWVESRNKILIGDFIDIDYTPLWEWA